MTIKLTPKEVEIVKIALEIESSKRFNRYDDVMSIIAKLNNTSDYKATDLLERASLGVATGMTLDELASEKM